MNILLRPRHLFGTLQPSTSRLAASGLSPLPRPLSTLLTMSSPQQQQPNGKRTGTPTSSRGRSGKRGRGHAPGPPRASGQDVKPFHSTGAPAQLVPKEGASTAASHLSDVTFASLKGTIDDRILSAIAFPRMTAVQAATISPALEGTDILAQAKTGTGKTVAFLLPAIQRILNSASGPQRGNVSVLILSPTRELAMQIANEAQILIGRLGAGQFGVQVCVGGTNKNAEAKKLANERCDILVATPGRLVDHIETTSGIRQRLATVQAYILDEADRMLDMGFAKELNAIKATLPESRQNLFFSATWPPAVIKIADARPNHKFINTVPPEEENTHKHVSQTYEVAPLQHVLPLTLKHILEERQRNAGKAKAIVFCPTANATALAAAAARGIKGNVGPVWEIHSRKSQPYRTKAMEEYRRASEGVLFASDVAARGVDIPGVSLVIQSGCPDSSDQYIHRLGRTARAGASGRGVLILADFEKSFLSVSEVRALPLEQAPATTPQELDSLYAAVTQSMQSSAVTKEEKSKAYQATLGHMKSNMRRLKCDARQIVDLANLYATDVLHYSDGEGNTIPSLSPKTVRMMGLQGVAGLRIVKEEFGGGGGGGGGRRGGGMGGRGRGGAASGRGRHG